MNTFGIITVSDCIATSPPPPDARCQDPAFAAANPTICPATPHLVIKPGTALVCALGSVKFTAVLNTNGIEKDVSADCVWSTSSTSIALIGVKSGNATGVAAGDATISATFENYSATAELTVMGVAGDCCSGVHVGMMLVVDKSLSMSQVFGSNYPTKLDFAKKAADRWVSEVNEHKDSVGLITFDDSATSLVANLTQDKASVESAVDGIAQGQQKTSFYAALKSAISALDVSTATLKVIVLISDGADTGADANADYVTGNNPLTLVSTFKNAGGIVICLGVRAAGGGFALLSALSTGGFFVNGVPGSESAALDYFSGLKGYVCAGNCTPSGDVIIGEGKLNYTAFAHWVVSGGEIDLLGNGFFDFLPGNGLYVDLGSGLAKMVSRTPFALTSGHQYRLSLQLGGNQVSEAGSNACNVKVYYMTGAVETVLFSQTILPNDIGQDFSPYSFTFTAPANVNAYIAIQGVVNDVTNKWGLLLDRVRFDDATDLVSLLYDTFDTENQVFIPPACGQSSLYGSVYGYNCYGVGCLDTPPPPQLPDPNPLLDTETGYVPPQTVTSTRTACASCQAGFRNLSTEPVFKLAINFLAPVEVEQYLTFTTSPAVIINRYDLLLIDPTIINQSPAQYDVSVQGSNDGATWTTLNTTYSKSIVSGTLTPNTLSVIFDNTTPFSQYRLTVTPALPSVAWTGMFQMYSGDDTESPNIIPDMTNAPHGVASASFESGTSPFTPGSFAYMAFSAPIVYLPSAVLQAISWTAPTLPAWLQYQFMDNSNVSLPTPIASYGVWTNSTTGQPKDWTFQGSNDGVTWTVLDTQTEITGWDTTSAQDVGLKKFPLANPNTFAYYRLNVTASNDGTVTIGRLTAYQSTSVPQSVCRTSTATGDSQSAADSAAYAAALADAQTGLNCQAVYTATEQVTKSCPLATYGPDAVVTKTAYSLYSQADAVAQAIAAANAEAQATIDADCGVSNNTQKSGVVGQGAFVRFGLTKFVTGQTGLITSVAVHLNTWNDTWPSDVGMFLSHRTPAGVITSVGLITGCGGSFTIAGVNLVLQTGGAALPATLITSGTYAPTNRNAIILANFGVLTPPTPPVPSSFNLADFNGLDPNGTWTLYALSANPGNNHSLVDGFDVVVTTA